MEKDHFSVLFLLSNLTSVSILWDARGSDCMSFLLSLHSDSCNLLYSLKLWIDHFGRACNYGDVEIEETMEYFMAYPAPSCT